MDRKIGYYWVVVATSNQDKIAYWNGEGWDLLSGRGGLYNDNMIKQIGAWVGDSFMREQANELSPLVMPRLIKQLDKWIERNELAAGKLIEIDMKKDAESFEAAATAYWAVKSFIEVNGV